MASDIAQILFTLHIYALRSTLVPRMGYGAVIRPNLLVDFGTI